MGRIIHVQDLNMPELQVYTHLNEVQLRRFYEPREGMFIAESSMVIGRALDAGYEPLSLLTEEPVRPDVLPLFERCGDVPIYLAPLHVLEQITGYHLTRGVLCAMRRRKLPDAQELCTGRRRIAVLENVTNPTNVGAIIRSAAAMNMEAVLLTPDCCDPLYRRAVRVSVGTVFQIPWTYVENMDCLKRMGFKTVAMVLRRDSLRIDDEQIRQEEKLAVILGAEGYGLNQETIEMSDYRVMIPMRGGVDSLNVAAAAAVAFWELSGMSRCP
ncbi:MAG: RNA methyltransferase [Eubacterium sp.]|nr:RNA methyltransferase [Eubacterium sp.]